MATKRVKTQFLHLFIVLICLPFAASAQMKQDVKILNVELKYSDDKVYIPYSIMDESLDETYVVWLEIFNEKKEKLPATFLTGDINTVYGSGSKRIAWDIKRDGLVINENIFAVVSAKMMPAANTAKAFGYSTIFPGAGDYQFKKGRPYWLKGVIAYGLLGGSAIMSMKSNKSYDDYRTSGLPSFEDPSFSKSKQQRQTSLILAGAGISMWLFDYIGLASKAKKHKDIDPKVIMDDKGFPLYSSASSMQKINTRGQPPNLFADLSFNDDNGNGIIEAREKASLSITLSNQGRGDALQLEVNVSDSTIDKSMVVGDAIQKIKVIKAGESVNIKIPITTDINLKTAKHKFSINVTEAFGFDMDPAYLILNTYAYQPPKLVVSGVEIIDAGEGLSPIIEDGQLQPGEQVRAKVIIQNIGQDIATSTKYAIVSNDANIYLDGRLNDVIGDVKPGEVKEIYFTLTANKRVVAKGKLPVFISLTEDIGRGSLKDEQLPIALNQKPLKPNIVTVNSDIESLKKNVARFEFTSNKFKTNIDNVANIKTVIPSLTKRPKSVGIIFGVKNYKELPSAPYADNDAKIMKEYFEKVLGIEQVVMYTNDQVSGFIFDDVFNPENGELQRAIIKGETEVFVFYSGHGIPDKTGENIYLFPSDGKISRLDAQGYNIEKLYSNLSKLGARHVTVILDACFSGGSRQSEKVMAENLTGQKGVKIKPKNTWLLDSKFTIISSSTGEETSLGFDATQTGLFTYFICAGLQGKADANKDKAITLGELKVYVKQNVESTSRKISGIQTPIFTGDDNTILVSFQ